MRDTNPKVPQKGSTTRLVEPWPISMEEATACRWRMVVAWS